MRVDELNESFPEIYSGITSLYGEVTVVATIVVSVGLIYKIWLGSFGDVGAILRALAMAALVAVLIPVFPNWMNEIQMFSREFIDDLGANPAETHQRYAELLIAESGDGSSESIGFWDVIWSDSVSLGEALSYALVWLASQLAFAVMYFLYLVQGLLMLTGVGLAPLFLALLTIASAQTIAWRYLWGLMSVVMWPLAWAVTSIFSDSLMQKAAEDGVYDLGVKGAVLSNSQFFIFTIVLTLWVLFSSAAAPLIITKVMFTGANLGSVLFGGFARSIGQGLSYGVGAGVTTRLAGGGGVATAVSATAAGGAGFVSAAAEHSSPLVPAAIGIAAARPDSENSQTTASWSERAEGIKGGK